MIRRRHSADRGTTELGWLHSRHSFSFAGYRDPQNRGHSVLRVINDDIVEPGTGFAEHSHRDMEILSYVLEGALEHRDTLGHHEVLHAGELQRMSAGTGVTHSEYNHSDVERVRFLQIWILPGRSNIEPGYEKQTVADIAQPAVHLCLVASPDGRAGSVTLHQDVMLYVARLGVGDTLCHVPGAARRAWIQVVSGLVDVNGCGLSAGDGGQVEGERELGFTAAEETEFLLFDLP